jgi:hypothetical protein
MTKSNPDELDFDYAVFVAEPAASLMSQLKIAPTPANANEHPGNRNRFLNFRAVYA